MLPIFKDRQMFLPRAPGKDHKENLMVIPINAWSKARGPVHLCHELAYISNYIAKGVRKRPGPEGPLSCSLIRRNSYGDKGIKN